MPGELWNEHPKIDRKEYSIFCSYILWLLCNSDADIEGIAERLKFPKPLFASIKDAQSLYRSTDSAAELSPSEFTIFVQNFPTHVLEAVSKVSSNLGFRKKTEMYATTWWQVQPHTDGHDLLAMGVEPGPIFQEVLTELRKAWLDGQVTSQEQEKALLQQLLGRAANSGYEQGQN
jgi:tRNA nucleotidyltransferase/poly(A) polymerase